MITNFGLNLFVHHLCTLCSHFCALRRFLECSLVPLCYLLCRIICNAGLLSGMPFCLIRYLFGQYSMCEPLSFDVLAVVTERMTRGVTGQGHGPQIAVGPGVCLCNSQVGLWIFFPYYCRFSELLNHVLCVGCCQWFVNIPWLEPFLCSFWCYPFPSAVGNLFGWSMMRFAGR